MSVVRSFLDPILKEVVAKKRAKGQTSVGDEQKNEDGEREVQEVVVGSFGYLYG
jgi:hypothetical protein